MIPKNILSFCLLQILIISSCKQKEETYINTINWSIVQNYYLFNLKTSISYLDSLTMIDKTSEKAKIFFKQSRSAFKKAEPYASYLNPEVGHRANGPALPVFKEDNSKILIPIGFQKIEESIFESEVENNIYLNELIITKGLLNVLKKKMIKRELNPQRFFISTHQQLLRVISHSITGFDTPVSKIGLEETKLTLNSLFEVYKMALQPIIKEKDSNLDANFNESIQKAITFIENNNDFETFDRYTFLRDYFNSITSNWTEIRKVSDIWDPINTTPFNFDASTFFENESFNLNYFTAGNNRNPSQAQIALGKRLFFDKNLSKAGTLACASCHKPELAYTDGLKTSIDNRGSNQFRNTPTLINTAFQKSFFWDGRAENMQDQITLVFTNNSEFNKPLHTFSDDILKDSIYIEDFKTVFGKIPNNNLDVIKAISSYVSTLNAFNSKFDKNIRGEQNNYTNEEKNGFNLFMGKALCATCHFMPISNGTVPPFFYETEKEVIGVPRTAANKALDSDVGFYWRFEEDIHYGMFKTPSVRNMGITGPYMHNGIYDTLEDVINFYNSGGGSGLGFDIPHQTLPFDELNLTEAEQKALVAFLKTLDATPKEGSY
ncbi:cytochrome-c peroxidase [Flavobacteriaceae bacterium AU392]|nr:cytochrome-c peroxidase [Flavobacteriaceae bacterium]RKM85867.1 cytochrome-c peroxidase [Flavobacteriaceae bacterium AU392]